VIGRTRLLFVLGALCTVVSPCLDSDHGIKKMRNPLAKLAKPIVLGDQIISLSYPRALFYLRPFTSGYHYRDVQDIQKQDFISAVRLFSPLPATQQQRHDATQWCV